MTKKAFYVTTPIFYPTGLPHVGTAYTVFIADTLARYHRLRGEDTQFLTGNDEHGANVAKKAEEAGKDPQTYVDEYAKEFKKIWGALGISNDYFIQTTDPRHKKFAEDLIQKAYDNGDIYEGTYEGWYCDSCEAYVTEKDLIDGKCPNHPTKEPRFTKEKNYYFKWSKYQDWLLEFYDENPGFVTTEKWAKYAREFVEQGLQDIPVTRANVKWGVQVPFDKEQTIYVWYDALANYYSYLHFEENEQQGFVEKFWPQSVHVVGKDIIKFHAILWPAMLKSAGYQPPKHVLCHGFFTVNGQKIGKSNSNAIHPVELADKYGVDAVRYALLSEFQVGNDGDFSFERLEAKYTADLANNWGNLLNRVIHLINTKDAKVEDEKAVSQRVKAYVDAKVAEYHEHFEHFRLFEACQIPNLVADWGNKYITERKPWEADTAEAQPTLNDLWYLLKNVNELYLPILPESAEKAVQALNKLERVILFPKLD